MTNKKIIIGLGLAWGAWIYWQKNKANAATQTSVPAPANAWGFTGNATNSTNKPATGNPVAPNYDTGEGVNGNW